MKVATFVAMMKRKEQISAWILLSVFVPMIVLTCFHIHCEPASNIDCDQCVEHVHHAGHITQHTASVDDCVLCRFVSERFVGAQSLQALVCERELVAVVVPAVRAFSAIEQRSIPSLRAPPTIL
ncbi:MAG: hypothetical protein J6I72_05800 [Muribaculaceae bacterium]|nr:hypothetical protein [Muribaculaceae bacterium]